MVVFPVQAWPIGWTRCPAFMPYARLTKIWAHFFNHRHDCIMLESGSAGTKSTLSVWVQSVRLTRGPTNNKWLHGPFQESTDEKLPERGSKPWYPHGGMLVRRPWCCILYWLNFLRNFGRWKGRIMMSLPTGYCLTCLSQGTSSPKASWLLAHHRVLDRLNVSPRPGLEMIVIWVFRRG